MKTSNTFAVYTVNTTVQTIGKSYIMQPKTTGCKNSIKWYPDKMKNPKTL